MQKLPVGIQSVKRLRQDNLVYIDKTRFIYNLVSGNGYYFFLSRPRRFGKSLLVSTLKELFQANRELFRSLWIDTSDYEWKRYPVIHLDFSAISSRTSDDLRTNLSWELSQIAKLYNINITEAPSPEAKLRALIDELAQNTPVVVLIDEYDKPLLEHVHNLEIMKDNQATLRNFYATLKAAGDQIHFLFMTGITKFSKTSVFSGMNNLVDLTLSPEAACLLGYTQEEIDTHFKPHIEEIASKQHLRTSDIKANMKSWYNGYQFSQEPTKVYNPFSVLMYLLTKDLRNYWFESGTPSFLVNLIKTKQYEIEHLDHAELNIGELSSFELDDLQLIPLLLQTGYLTIKQYDPETRNYKLGYPNEETKASFLQYFMGAITKTQVAVISNTISRLKQSLTTKNLNPNYMLEVHSATVCISEK